MGKALLLLGVVLLLAFSVSAGSVTTYDGYGFERAGVHLNHDIPCYTFENRLVCPFKFDNHVSYKTIYTYDGPIRYYIPDYTYRPHTYYSESYYTPSYRYHIYYNTYQYNGELNVFGRYLERRIESSYDYTPSNDYFDNNYQWDGRSTYNED